MAQAFNLTAQLNLRGPSNVKKIAADIRRELGTVSANVQFKLDPSATRNVSALNSALRNLNTSFTDTVRSANDATRAIRAFSTAVNSVNIKNIPQQVNATAVSVSKLNRAASSTGKQLSEASSEMQEFGKQAGLAIRRFTAFTTVTGLIYSLTNSINSGINAFIEYDKELVRLQQVTGQSAKGLQDLQNSISTLSMSLGVSSKELTTVSVTLAQAGLSAKDTERALRALALSSLAPSFDDMNETVEGSIALMRQFGIGAGQLEHALGSVNAVAAAFAVEADDLITAIQRTGGVFATASKGVSEGTDALNEFIAVFTSVRATTRESAETIATGLRTIFTRIQRGDTIDALKEFGISLTDAEGKFVGAYKAVQLLSQGLSKLDPRDIKFSGIVEELGGFRQIGKVIPLIQQFATAQDALKVAQRGQGSLAADAAKAQESLANRITKVKEEFLALFRTIGQSQGFQTLVSGSLSLASALIKVADATKGLLPALSILAAFKGASALTQFSSGFSRGFRRGGGQNAQEPFYRGGPVRKFARGGVVPGSGNRDTVPAMLTPGEFVIRKKAVETIGAHNLHNMNKYASGGKVKKFARGGSITVKGDVPDRSLLDTSLVESTWSELITNIGKQFSPTGKTRTRKFSNLDPRQQGAVKGYVFEEALRAAGQGADTKGGDFDYRNWRKNKNFNKLETGDIVDAKISAQKVTEAEFAKKIANLQKNNPEIDIKKLSFGAAMFDPNTSDFDLEVPLEKIKKYKQKHLGGLIRKFATAGEVSSTGGKPASRSDILNVLGAKAAAQAAGVSAAEIYELLGKRNPTSSEKSMIEAVQKEYITKTNRIAGAAKGLTTRLQNQGLTFAAAGMFGKPFGAKNEKIESPALSSAPTVRIVSGVLKPEVAKELDNIFNEGISKTTSRATEAVMRGYGTSDIISEITPNINTDSSIQGGLLERVIQELGGPGSVKGMGFDFPNGLKRAAKYFNLPEDIPTDLKRTLSGPSTIKDNAVTYLKNVLGYAMGGRVQKFAGGGLAKAPLVDDILQASGAILPKPSDAIAALINAGGGAVDVDRTLKRTLGDKAYASAPSLEAKQAVLSKYFRDDKKRLEDMKSAPLTSFGKELIAAIRSGKLDPNALSIISKSQRTEGVAEYLSQLFSIPVQNMAFTQGGDKQPALDAIRNKGPRINRVRKFLGGFIQKFKLGGSVYDLQNGTGLSNGEFDEIVKFANTNDFNMDEFKTYLARRIQQKKSKSDLMINSASLLRAITPEATGSTQKQLDLANMLRGQVDAKFNPKYDNAVKYAIGGSVEDTVPALLTPGEFVINKKAASRIGSAKLHQLNNADKIQGYNKGGVVGGGIIQKFAGGGMAIDALSSLGVALSRLVPQQDLQPTISSRPGNIGSATVEISKDVSNNIKSLVSQLNAAGVSAASLAEIVKRGGQISYEAAQKALEEDIKRLKITGASLEQITQAESTLASVRASGKQEVTKKQFLEAGFKESTVGSNLGSGASQQQILAKAAQIEGQILSQKEKQLTLELRRTGLSQAEAEQQAKTTLSSSDQKTLIKDQAVLSATQSVTGVKKSELTAMGVSGSDIQKYISESMRDRKTLAQMDKQLIANKLQETQNNKAYQTASKAVQQQMLTEAKKVAQEEISVRRKMINDIAAQTGGSGVGAAGLTDLRNSPVLNTLKNNFDPRKAAGFSRTTSAISLIGGAMSGQGQNIASMMYSNKTTEGRKQAAGTGAGIESSTSILSAGMMVAAQTAMIPVVGPYVAGIAAVGTAALAAADYFTDFTGAQKQAIEEFERQMRAKEIGEATDTLDKAFKNFESDIGNIDLQAALNDALSRAVVVQAKDTVSNMNQAQRDYSLKNRTWSDIFTGNMQGTAQMGAPEMKELQRAEADKYAQYADKAYRQIQSQVDSGATLDQIMKDGNLRGARNAIALSDAEGVGKYYTDVEAKKQELGRDLNDEERQAIIDNIAARKIETSDIIKNAIKNKELADAMEAANRAGRELTRSFTKLFDTIGQSINRIQYESKQRQVAMQSNTSALRGQAEMQDIDLRELNVLANPQAYKDDPKAFNQAVDVAANMLGGEQGEMLRGAAKLQQQLPDSMTNAIAAELKGNKNLTAAEAASKAKQAGIAQIQALNLPPDVTQTLINKLSADIDKKSEELKGQFDTDSTKATDIFIESIRNTSTALGEIGGEAVEAARKLIEERQRAFNQFAKNVQMAAQAAKQAINYFKAAKDIRYKGDMDLREAQTGVGETYAEAKSKFDSDIGTLTGGITDPAAVRANIESLNQERKKQEKDREAAIASGDTSKAEELTRSLQNTNDALNNNREALDKMANSADLAQKALQEVSNISKLQAERENLANKLLTSTPEELDNLNKAFVRLQRNLNGGLNNADNQRDARKAFNETLRSTGSVREATKAGNTVLAQQRKETLGLMQDPGYRAMMEMQIRNNAAKQGKDVSSVDIDTMFRKQEAQLMKQMAIESGMMNNPMIRDAIAAKENPNADPAMKRAADQFLQAIGLQSKATEEQGRLELASSQEMLKVATDDLNVSIKDLSSRIDNIYGSTNSGDKVSGVNSVGENVVAVNFGVGRPVQAASNGGVIYAANGKLINFKPMGTDTVPAMLTPGEFVINRAATQKHLPLLKAINSGSDNIVPKNMNNGGAVYLAAGGRVKKDETLAQDQAFFDQSVAQANEQYMSGGGRENAQQQMEAVRQDAESSQREAFLFSSNSVTPELAARDYAVSLQTDPQKWGNMSAEQQQEVIAPYIPQAQTIFDTKKAWRYGSDPLSEAQINQNIQSYQNTAAQKKSELDALTTQFNAREAAGASFMTPSQQLESDKLATRRSLEADRQIVSGETKLSSSDLATRQAAGGNKEGIATETQINDYINQRTAQAKSAIDQAERVMASTGINTSKGLVDHRFSQAIQQGMGSSRTDMAGKKWLADPSGRLRDEEGNTDSNYKISDFYISRTPYESSSYNLEAIKFGSADSNSYKNEESKATSPVVTTPVAATSPATPIKAVEEAKRLAEEASAASSATNATQLTEAQMFYKRAEELAPKKPADIGKPKTMAEVGMYREGLARGMTIDEIKYERQQAYLSRFRPEVAAAKAESMGSMLMGRSPRMQALEDARKAETAQTAPASASDTYPPKQPSPPAAVAQSVSRSSIQKDASRRALQAIPEDQRTPDQQNRYLQLKYENDIAKGKVFEGTSLERYAELEKQKQYNRDDKRFEALSKKDYYSLPQRDLDFILNYEQQQRDRRGAVLAAVKKQEEAFGSTLGDAEKASKNNNDLVARAKGTAEAYKSSLQYETDQKNLTKIEQQRQQAQFENFISSNLEQGTTDPAKLGEYWAKQQGFKEEERQRLGLMYEKQASDFIKKNTDSQTGQLTSQFKEQRQAQYDQAEKEGKSITSLINDEFYGKLDSAQKEINNRTFSTLGSVDQRASSDNIDKIKEQARAYAEAADKLSGVKNVNSAKQIAEYRAQAEALSNKAASLTMNNSSDAQVGVDTARASIVKSNESLASEAIKNTVASAMTDKGLDKYASDKNAAEMAKERAVAAQQAAAEKAEEAKVEAEARAQEEQLSLGAPAAEDNRNNLWINSDNWFYKGLGYAGGLGEAAGNAAYGAANVVAGAATVAASPVIGYFAGNGAEEVARGEKLSAQIRTIQQKQAAMGVLGAQGTDQRVALAQAQAIDYRGESSTAAAAMVGAKAIAQGAYTAVEAAQAIVGQGPIMTGDKTWLTQGDDERVEQAGPYGGTTRTFQNIGFAASQGVQMATGFGMSTGTSMAGRFAKGISAVDNLLSNPGTIVRGVGKGAGRAVKTFGDTQLGQDIRTGYNAVKDTATLRGPMRNNIDAAYGTVSSRSEKILADRYARITGGDYSRSSEMLRSRAARLTELQKNRAKGIKDSTIANRVENRVKNRRLTNFLDSTDAQEAADNAAYIKYTSKPRISAEEFMQRQKEAKLQERARRLEGASRYQSDMRGLLANRRLKKDPYYFDHSQLEPINDASISPYLKASRTDRTAAASRLEQLRETRRSGNRDPDIQRRVAERRAADAAYEREQSYLSRLVESVRQRLGNTPRTPQDIVSKSKPIKLAEGTPVELGARVEARQKAVIERLSEYASSDEARERLATSGALDIDNIRLNSNLTARDAQVGTRSARAAYRSSAKRGEGAIGFKSADVQDAVIDHELAHALQNNSVGGLTKAKGGTSLVYEDLLREKLGSDMSAFLTDSEGYARLLKSTDQNKFGKMYNAKTIMNEPVELFTSLVQASNSPQFKKNKQAVRMLRQLMEFHGYAKGGMVYANNGALIAARPNGSDTVPAMLTPGEFVINRNSAQKHMPVLEAINSGRYNRGGIVNYMANGGLVQPKYYNRGGGVAGPGVSSAGVSNDISSAINSAMNGLGNIVSQISQLREVYSMVENSVNQLSSTAQTFVGGLSDTSYNMVAASQNLSQVSIPENIQFTGQVNQNHSFNGAEAANHVLATLGPTMQQTANDAVGSVMNNFNKGVGQLDAGSLGPDTSSIMGGSRRV